MRRPHYVRDLRGRCRRYVLKEAADTDVVDAVRAVAAGERYVHPASARLAAESERRRLGPPPSASERSACCPQPRTRRLRVAASPSARRPTVRTSCRARACERAERRALARPVDADDYPPTTSTSHDAAYDVARRARLPFLRPRRPTTMTSASRSSDPDVSSQGLPRASGAVIALGGRAGSASGSGSSPAPSVRTHHGDGRAVAHELRCRVERL
jgi:hypothetical protein